MCPSESLYPLRSPLGRDALREALNTAGPWSWAVRDSVYFGVYLRGYHEPSDTKLRILGDGPLYLLDLGDDPPPIALEGLVDPMEAADDPAALELLPFPAAPLDLYDEGDPAQARAPILDDKHLTELAAALMPEGEEISVVAFQVGTPASFYSENPRQPAGHHFDICGPGTTDVEIDLHSPELVALMRDMPGVAADQRIARSGKWAFFTNNGPGGFYSACPSVAACARAWSGQLGRDVEFRLRIAAEPVTSIKTPGAGGPIELLRILPSVPAESQAGPRAERTGLWKRIRRLFR
jgi:hypothetical protein